MDVLTKGQVIRNLSHGSGIEIDYPFYKRSKGPFILLYWNDTDGDGKGEWIDVSKLLNKDKLSQALTTPSVTV